MTDRTNHSLFLACVHLVRSGLVWSGKKFCLWVWSEGRNQQPSFCVWGHFAWCNKQPNTQPGDPRRSLLCYGYKMKGLSTRVWFFGFEICTIFLRVSVSVLENVVSEKMFRCQFRKIKSQEKNLGFSDFGLKKVSNLVLEYLV